MSTVIGLKAQVDFSEKLAGHWTMVGSIDIDKSEKLDTANINWPDFKFTSDGMYEHGDEKGTWEYNEKENEITFYKSEYDESDEEMAEYLNKPIKEATKSTLGDFHIDNGLLYFSVMMEVDPLIYLLVFKKVNYKIKGTWGDNEMENAKFVFYADSVYYPDPNLWYSYKINSDTIYIFKEDNSVEKILIIDLNIDSLKVKYLDYNMIESYRRR
jgi:hypothetical protein